MEKERIVPADPGEKFWENPENILRLIDLIFFFDDNRETIPS